MRIGLDLLQAEARGSFNRMNARQQAWVKDRPAARRFLGNPQDYMRGKRDRRPTEPEDEEGWE